MEIGKAHIVRKNIFNFKVGQILTLIRYGYQAYFGEYNDMKIYHHLEEYFEKLDSK